MDKGLIHLELGNKAEAFSALYDYKKCSDNNLISHIFLDEEMNIAVEVTGLVHDILKQIEVNL